jgi:hypothetical protein
MSGFPCREMVGHVEKCVANKEIEGFALAERWPAIFAVVRTAMH